MLQKTGIEQGATQKANLVGPLRPERERYRMVPAELIQKRKIDWLWKPYIVRSALNMLTGDPGIGKSTIVCEIVMALNEGRPLPGMDGTPVPIRTWIMNAEDNADDTIVWRLDNQGAKRKGVFITDQCTPIDAAGAKEVRRKVRGEGIGLLIIDPIQSWMGSGVDMNRANETREWGNYLKEVAVEEKCAVLMIRHRRKAAQGDNRLYSGMGSIDFSGMVRSEISVSKGRDGTLYLHRLKGNVGQTGKGLGYRIVGVEDPENDHGQLQWLGNYDDDAIKAEIKASKVPKLLGKAIQFIHDCLKDGPKPAQEVFKLAAAAGISDKTLKRAKDGVARSVQLPSKEWVWVLEATTPSEDPILVCTK